MRFINTAVVLSLISVANAAVFPRNDDGSKEDHKIQYKTVTKHEEKPTTIYKDNYYTKTDVKTVYKTEYKVSTEPAKTVYLTKVEQKPTTEYKTEVKPTTLISKVTEKYTEVKPTTLYKTEYKTDYKTDIKIQPTTKTETKVVTSTEVPKSTVSVFTQTHVTCKTDYKTYSVTVLVPTSSSTLKSSYATSSSKAQPEYYSKATVTSSAYKHY